MQLFKPMLASAILDLKSLTYPKIGSPKIDGVRALVKDGALVSRRLKPIPNKYLQEVFGKADLEGFDGELALGNPWDCNLFLNTTSAVMSIEGAPEVKLHVFDQFNYPEEPYTTRIKDLPDKLSTDCVLVPSLELRDAEEAECYELACIDKGYEGIMLRNPKGRYKYGRSTLKEELLLKVKRFRDSEAVVLGFEERLHNTNEPVKNGLGQTERSTKKEGLVGMNTLGALIVSDIHTNKTFSIGSGFDDTLRKELWSSRTSLKGLLVKYKFFANSPAGIPRFPIFLGFRDKLDL